MKKKRNYKKPTMVIVEVNNHELMAPASLSAHPEATLTDYGMPETETWE